jgi:hypothetical protein
MIKDTGSIGGGGPTCFKLENLSVLKKKDGIKM